MLCMQKILYLEPPTCSFENGKYVESIIYDLVIVCDKIIEVAKTVSTKSVPTKTVPAKTTSTNFYILLAFLLIIIALLIAISINCCLIKYRVKQKHLLPHHITNNKLKEILFWQNLKNE